MNIETYQAIVNAIPVLSSDPTRYMLQKVLIEKHAKDQVSVTACDGHRITQVILINEFLANEISEKNPKGFLIDLAEIKRMKTMKPKFIEMKFVEKSQSGQDLIYSLNNELNIRVELNGKGGEYPDYRQATPDYSKTQTTKISFNAEYLEEMLRAMRENKRETNVVIEFDTPEKPYLVHVGDRTGVLMPVRIKK